MYSQRFLVILGLTVSCCQAITGIDVFAGKDDDLSVGIVESTMTRWTPKSLSGWQYFGGLYLLGQYEVYRRTGEPRYLAYIRDWADRWIDADGNATIVAHSLDDIQAANVFLLMFDETKDPKYRQAARSFRDVLDTYPRTKEGGFWHSEHLPNELWADGVFMVNPFLIRYGNMFDDADYSNDETVKQLEVYGKYLQADNGLLQHAYDESRQKKGWADPKTGVSREQWCRAMAWYGLTLTEVLDILPNSHPKRDELLSILRKFAAGIEHYQDPKSGRWFQVVNKADNLENWTETSCSAMFTLTVSRSLEKGYIEGRNFLRVVEKGAAGVAARIDQNENGLFDIHEICIGTSVGDLAYYFNRPRVTNDLHGLGAVILMSEQVYHR